MRTSFCPFTVPLSRRVLIQFFVTACVCSRRSPGSCFQALIQAPRRPITVKVKEVSFKILLSLKPQQRKARVSEAGVSGARLKAS